MTEVVVGVALAAGLFALFGAVGYRGCTGHCPGCAGTCDRFGGGDQHVP